MGAEKCQRCEKRAASEPHVCPYQWEIHDDEETQCNCCERCTGDCADDI